MALFSSTSSLVMAMDVPVFTAGGSKDADIATPTRLLIPPLVMARATLLRVTDVNHRVSHKGA